MDYDPCDSDPEDSYLDPPWVFYRSPDPIKEHFVNVECCIHALRALISKEDVYIDELERDLVSLQSELAWVEHDEWSEICCNKLREKIDHLHAAVRSLKISDKDELGDCLSLQRQPAESLHEITRALLSDFFQEKNKQDKQVSYAVVNGSDPPVNAALHLERSKKYDNSASASLKEEVKEPSITPKEDATITNTSLMLLENRINSSETIKDRQVSAIVVNSSDSPGYEAVHLEGSAEYANFGTASLQEEIKECSITPTEDTTITNTSLMLLENRTNSSEKVEVNDVVVNSSDSTGNAALHLEGCSKYDNSNSASIKDAVEEPNITPKEDATITETSLMLLENRANSPETVKLENNVIIEPSSLSSLVEAGSLYSKGELNSSDPESTATAEGKEQDFTPEDTPVIQNSFLMPINSSRDNVKGIKSVYIEDANGNDSEHEVSPIDEKKESITSDTNITSKVEENSSVATADVIMLDASLNPSGMNTELTEGVKSGYIKEANGNDSKLEVRPIDEKKKSMKSDAKITSKVEENSSMATVDVVMLDAPLNYSGMSTELDEVLKSAYIKEANGNDSKHEVSPINKKKESSKSDANITNDEVEKNSFRATADVVMLDTAFNSSGKSTELDEVIKLAYIKDANGNDSKHESSPVKEKKELSKFGTIISSEEVEENSFMATADDVMLDASLNSSGKSTELDEVVKSAYIKDVNGNNSKHEVSPVKEKKELSKSDTMISNEEVEENSFMTTADVVMLDASLNSSGKSPELDEVVKSACIKDANENYSKHEVSPINEKESSKPDTNISSEDVTTDVVMIDASLNSSGKSIELDEVVKLAYIKDANGNDSKHEVCPINEKESSKPVTKISSEEVEENSFMAIKDVVMLDTYINSSGKSTELDEVVKLENTAAAESGPNISRGETVCCVEMTKVDDSAIRVDGNEEFVSVDSLMQVTSLTGMGTDSKCIGAEGGNSVISPEAFIQVTGLDNRGVHKSSISRQEKVGNADTILALEPLPGFSLKRNRSESRLVASEQEKVEIPVTFPALESPSGFSQKRHNSDSRLDAFEPEKHEISDTVPALEPPPSFRQKRNYSDSRLVAFEQEKVENSKTVSALEPPSRFSQRRNNSDSRLVAFEHEAVEISDIVPALEPPPGFSQKRKNFDSTLVALGREKTENSHSVTAVEHPPGFSQKRNDSDSRLIAFKQGKIENSYTVPASEHPLGFDQKRNNSDSRLVAFKRKNVENCDINQKLCDIAQNLASRKRGIKGSNSILADKSYSSSYSSGAEGKRKAPSAEIRKARLTDTEHSALSSLSGGQEEKGKATTKAKLKQVKMPAQELLVSETGPNCEKLNSCLPLKLEKQKTKRKPEAKSQSVKRSDFSSVRLVPNQSLKGKRVQEILQHGQSERKQHAAAPSDMQIVISQPQKKRKEKSGLPVAVEVKSPNSPMNFKYSQRATNDSAGKIERSVSKTHSDEPSQQLVLYSLAAPASAIVPAPASASAIVPAPASASAIVPAPASASALKNMTVDGLRAIAKRNKLKRYSKLRKADLIALIARELGYLQTYN